MGNGKQKEKFVVTDTISDMLTRIRNANMIKHQIVQIPVTKMSLAICLILKEEGYIDNFEIYSEQYAKNKNQAQYILLSLKYKGKDRQPVITKLQRISKPGLRVYCDSKNLPKVLGNLGIAIISTSQGIMTNLKQKNLVLVVKFYVIFGNLKNYMSRIGKLPVKVPSEVKVNISNNDITVKGKFGELKTSLPAEFDIKEDTGVLKIVILKETKSSKSLHGLYRSLINNMVIGVSSQFKITLELNGVGYRAAAQKDQITKIILTGCDKQALGLFASQIRAWRVPEPYKGKGIKYENETILRKAGKSGKK